MIRLNVPDMSCDHCAGVITKAVKALDQHAEVSFDMPAHVIEVASTNPGGAPATDALLQALDAVGFPATLA